MIDFLKRLTILGALIGALMYFFIWDESSSVDGRVIILPYTLNYEYKDKDEGYQKASRWLITFDLTFATLPKQKECEQYISKENYEILRQIPVNSANKAQRLLPAWVYQTKVTDTFECELQPYTDFIKQPSLAQAQKQNTMSKGKWLVNKFEQEKNQ